MFLSIIVSYLISLITGIIPSVLALSDNRVDNQALGAPQPITTCIELQNMSNNLSGYYKLMNDLNCADSRDWNGGAGFAPIGSERLKFTGTFDGNNKTIHNIAIRRPNGTYVGLFGDMAGDVYNLNLFNVSIQARDKSSAYAGALAGANHGTIANLRASGNVEGNVYVGGLVGQNYGKISDASSSAKVTGHNKLGGLIGANVENAGKVVQSFASGKVEAGKDGVEVGGLVGLNGGYVYSCYATGRVIANAWVGGLVGVNIGQEARIENTYASGAVHGGGRAVGGLVGEHASGLIIHSYAIGRVNNGRADNPLYVGGLIGHNKGSVSNAYHNTETTGQLDKNKSLPLKAEQMLHEVSFEGWDFNDTWKIKEGYDYPRLAWQDVDFDIRFMPVASSQNVYTPFQVTVLANTPDFSGRVQLSSDRGPTLPTYVDLVNGRWTGNVTVYTAGLDDNLELWWYNDQLKGNGGARSNPIAVADTTEDLNPNARLYGTIVDDHGIPLNGTMVQLYENDPTVDRSLQASYTNYTDARGNYQLNQVIPGDWHFVANRIGFQEYSKEVELDSFRSITNILTLNRVCKNTDNRTPILLVPGIMGSTTSDGSIYPRLPFRSHDETWKTNELSLLDPLAGTWFEVVGWDSLRKNLINNYGYQEGCTLFDVPYDWSLTNEVTRELYLRPWIKEAQKIANATQVDVIAHSMGGLLTRSHIQAPDYPKDVRKFAMVGTPNKGAGSVYYVWEGGDPIRADEVMGDSAWSSMPGHHFYTNTLNYLYEKRKGRSVCSFGNIIRYTPESCDYDKIYDFAHESARSPGQLIPIYDYALKQVPPKTSILPLKYEENMFVKALNNLPCYNPNGCVDQQGTPYKFATPSSILTADGSGVQTKLFAGIGETNTVQSSYVYPNTNGIKDKLYQDGFPPDKVAGSFSGADGDGTVQKTSVNLNDYFPSNRHLPYQEGNGEHAELISVFKDALIQFITGKSSSSPVDKAQTALIINTSGRVQASINVRPNQLDVEFETGSFDIVNPSDGQYTIYIYSPYQVADYEAIVVLNDVVNEQQISRRFSDVSPKGLQIFTVTLSNSNLTFDRLLDAPTDLEMCSSNNNIQLQWNDPVGDSRQDVARYEIYWKPDAHPYYQLLDSTTAKQYQTSNNWTNAKTDVYAVKAVLKDGRKTVLSEATFYRSCLDAAPFNIVNLNGENGFVIKTASKLLGVTGLGDVNGDGIEDVGLSGAKDGHDQSYVIYGRVDQYPAVINAEQLLVKQGFSIVDDIYSNLSTAIGHIGDMNNDGLADIAATGSSRTGPGTDLRFSYTYLGSKDESQTVKYASNLNGQNGFVATVKDAETGAGVNDKPIDFNGDGINDLVIGGQTAHGGGYVYVIYGTTSGFPKNINLANLDGRNGVIIDGHIGHSCSSFGNHIASLGDINGDGIHDVAISDHAAPYSGTWCSRHAGAVYVVFGSRNFPNRFSIANLNGTNGFTITSAYDADVYTGSSISGGGDINGDGVKDVLISGPGAAGAIGEVYVVFGRRSGYPVSLSLSSLNGQNGFTIVGEYAGWFLGSSVNVIGDFNADGIDDFFFDTTAGPGGRGFVVYGFAKLFPTRMSTAQINQCNGLIIESGATWGGFNQASGSGDFNQDGVADLIVGLGVLSGGDNAAVIFGGQ